MKNVERKILLNPGPATTTDTVKQSLIVPDICPREEEFCNVLEEIKNDLVKIVHGEESYTSVMFAASGTGGLEAAITSAVPYGKKLLVIENGAYGTRMVKLAETFKIDVVRYQINYGDYPEIQVIESLLKTNNEVSHIAVVHHETTTGMLNPIQEICDLSHKYGKEVIVDCMSSYAGIPIEIEKWDAEYIISSSNKCIQGMAGLTFVIFKKKLLEKIKHIKRSFYFDIYNQHTGFENTGQMQFTPPVQVAYALRQAINEYFNETEEGRWKRYLKNWETLYAGLKKLGFAFLLPEDQQSKILLAVNEPDSTNYNFEAMHNFLFDRGFTIYPGKGAKQATFRLAILGDLYKKDIEQFLVALEAYMVSAKIKIT